MKRVVLSLMMAAAVLAVSGCAAKAKKPVCVGCENLPDCVPGPLGDCIKK